MRESYAFDYAVIRFVPRVEREEFINVGVILSCPARKFLEAEIELNKRKVKSLAPEIKIKEIRRYLSPFARICAGEKSAGVIGQMPQRARFYWLTAQRSTIIQCSPVHTGFCEDAAAMLEHLLNVTVR